MKKFKMMFIVLKIFSKYCCNFFNKRMIKSDKCGINIRGYFN